LLAARYVAQAAAIEMTELNRHEHLNRSKMPDERISGVHGRR
jgi:hypothetical protein